jgi:hypothetical protein
MSVDQTVLKKAETRCDSLFLCHMKISEFAADGTYVCLTQVSRIPRPFLSDSAYKAVHSAERRILEKVPSHCGQSQY